MKKQKIVALSFLFGLIIVAIIYFFSDSAGNLSIRNTNFAIENINRINRIQISDGIHIVKLEKDNNQWLLNTNYTLKKKTINDFLIVLNRIKLYSPVSKNEKDQIASQLKKEGILVEIFDSNKILKKYYVSSDEMAVHKTYMMMYKSSEPYIVHVPASKHKVSDWFNVNENFWRNNILLDYLPQHLKTIRLEYENISKGSFLLKNIENHYTIQEINTNVLLDNPDKNKVEMYMTSYKGLYFDEVAKNLSYGDVDSILKSAPLVEITIEDFNGEMNSLKIYRKPPEKELDEFGQKATMDYVRAYAVYNESPEIFLVRYQIIDPLLKEFDYFR